MIKVLLFVILIICIFSFAGCARNDGLDNIGSDIVKYSEKNR